MMHDDKSDHDSIYVYAASSPSHSSTGSPKPYYVESPYSSQADNGSRITRFRRQSSTLRCSSASSTSSWNWRYLRINANECQVIEEDDDDFTFPIPPYVMAVLLFALFLTAFCFITWSVGRIYKPQFSIQSLKVNRLLIGAGSDFTGVPSTFITVNCTTVISVHNPATFFGIHITSQMAHVMYMEIPVATGNLKDHYLGKTSQGNVTMELYGSRVPLYGAGAALHDGRKIPLKLDMELQTRGYIIGRLVKTTHTKHITCSFAFSQDSTDITRDSSGVNLKQHSCTYK